MLGERWDQDGGLDGVGLGAGEKCSSLGLAVPVVWAGLPPCRVAVQSQAGASLGTGHPQPGLCDLIALYRGPTFLVLDPCRLDTCAGVKGDGREMREWEGKSEGICPD